MTEREPREIALLVGFDPTVRGACLADYPIRSHVKRAICFNPSPITPESWIFGGAVYSRAQGGPKIVVRRKGVSHLAAPRMRKPATVHTARGWAS